MTGGNVPDSTLRLRATPASVTPEFSFGCGRYDGTASCDLSALDAKSAKGPLQAQITVPATATAVTSVTLTAIGSAAHLATEPIASTAVAITAAVVTASVPSTTVNPLPVDALPNVPAGSPALSPGGNAAVLFPTLQPAADPLRRTRSLSARSVADSSALPQAAPVAAAQLAGLAALALAFVLTVTRLSSRRRPVPATQAPAGPRDEQQGES